MRAENSIFRRSVCTHQPYISYFLIDNSNTLELIDETSFKGVNSLSDSPGKRSSFSLELVKNEAQPVPIYL
jgi:hypothetical protein